MKIKGKEWMDWLHKELQKKSVEAYVLAEKVSETNEIESGALIEKRNRARFGVLAAFIPQGLRLPAEDSYDIQTFKAYDLTGVLKAHARRVIEALPDEQREIVRAILNQPSVKRQPIDCHLKYLLAVRGEGGAWHEAGAHLYHLNLIPIWVWPRRASRPGLTVIRTAWLTSPVLTGAS